MRVYIDPGHGGINPGASYNGRTEQADVYRLAVAVKDFVERQGIEVMLSRGADDTPVVEARAEQANQYGADYFVSIHRNAFVPEKASGAEVWCYSQITKGGKTYKKAERLLELVCAATGYKNRGVHLGAPNYTDFAVNRSTKMSSCLLEVGFVDNTADNKAFDTYFDALANNVAQGICEAVGVEYVPDAPVIEAPIVDYEGEYARMKEKYEELLENVEKLKTDIKNILDKM